MKKGRMLLRLIILIALAVSTACLSSQPAPFSYQGRLLENSSPATGVYNFGFRLFDQATGGVLLSDPVAKAGTTVNNGVFTVELDFGAEVLARSDLWLEITVTRPGGALEVLSPRQKLLPSPRATHSLTAGAYAGAVSDTQLSTNVALLNASQTFAANLRFASASGTFFGTFIGNGVGLTNVTATGGTGGIGSAFSGRVNQLPSSPNTVFGGISGVSDAVGLEDSVTTLSPGQSGIAQNLSVRLNAAPGSGRSLKFTLRVNGTDTDVTCTIADNAATGSSGGGTAAVPAGAVLSMRIDSIGAPNSGFACFGWLLK